MVYFAADHNGIVLKRRLLAYCAAKGIASVDCNPKNRAADDDYPDVVAAFLRRFSSARGGTGVLICGSGNGMAIAANRHARIRAALAPAPAFARKAREDEDANVLVLPAWWMTKPMAIRTFVTWMSTPFSRAPRHRRRIQKLSHRPRG